MLIRKRARESARLARRGTQASAPPSSAPTRLHWTSRPARLRSPRVTHRRSSSRSSTATSWRPHRRYALRPSDGSKLASEVLAAVRNTNGARAAAA